MFSLSNGVVIKQELNDTAGGTVSVPIVEHLVKQEPELVIYDFNADDAAGDVHTTAGINNSGVKQSPMPSTSTRIPEVNIIWYFR